MRLNWRQIGVCSWIPHVTVKRMCGLFTASILFIAFLAMVDHIREFSISPDKDLVFHVSNSERYSSEDPRITAERARLKKHVDSLLQKVYNSSLASMALENGGEPMRVIIFATWRTGSTFLGQLLASHPGAYYFHEPLFGLLPLDARRNPSHTTRALQVTKNILRCRYVGLPRNYFKDKQRRVERELLKNDRLKAVCKGETSMFPTFKSKISMLVNGSNAVQDCMTPGFMSRLCAIYPLHIYKEVRMPLASAKNLLEDKKLNAKVVFLFRDPRGIMESRKHVPWCAAGQKSGPGCFDARHTCEDMVEDYEAATKLTKVFPSRFYAVRYEELTSDWVDSVPRLFHVLNLTLTDETKSYLTTHTEISDSSPHVDDAWASMVKDTKSNAFKWIKKSQPEEIQEIQKVCRRAMELYGYKIINHNLLSSYLGQKAVLGQPSLKYNDS